MKNKEIKVTKECKKCGGFEYSNNTSDCSCKAKTNKEIAEEILNALNEDMIIAIDEDHNPYITNHELCQKIIIQALDAKDAEVKGKIEELINKHQQDFNLCETITGKAIANRGIEVLKELKKELYGE